MALNTSWTPGADRGGGNSGPVVSDPNAAWERASRAKLGSQLTNVYRCLRVIRLLSPAVREDGSPSASAVDARANGRMFALRKSSKSPTLAFEVEVRNEMHGSDACRNSTNRTASMDSTAEEATQ